MKTSRLFMGFGAAALALASVSAQAGTRAADFGAVSVQPVKASAEVARSSKSAKKKSELAGVSGTALIIGALALAAVVVGIVAATDDNDRSPGS